MSQQKPIADSGDVGLSHPTSVVGSSLDAIFARRWVERDVYVSSEPIWEWWTPRQMIDHFGFIEANRIGAKLVVIGVGTKRLFRVDVRKHVVDVPRPQTALSEEKEKIPEENPPKRAKSSLNESS